MYDKNNILNESYHLCRLFSRLEECGEIVYSGESTISPYPRFYTPINSSSTCNTTPPTISKAHKTIGIAEIPNIFVTADSPIQPKNPNTIIMVGRNDLKNLKS